MASNSQNIPQRKQFAALIPKNRVGEVENQQVVVGASTDCPRYFRVLYTKYAPTKKRKNKSFLDGYMVFGGTAKGKGSKNVVLLDEDSKEKVSMSQSKVPMVSNILKQRDNGDEGGDESFRLGSWEVEVDVEIEEKEFLSGQAFLAGGSVAAIEPSLSKYSYPGKKTTGFLKLSNKSVGGVSRKKLTPLFNPDGPEAMVLNRAAWEQNKEEVCPVVLDPKLYKCMRPHQREGVQFLYDCTMHMNRGKQGCILADQMGLGKTLQTISFLYTVLKQGPRNHPLVKKALVVAPSSLTENWKREIKKWLGDEKLRCCILAGQQVKEDIVAFKHGMLYPIAITSYEMMRKVSSDLASHVDIIIADEGHRLKSAAGNKTIAALNQLRCPRKIILSGTPLQNNLGELFAMCDFVNPGCLGSLATFQKVFEGAIVKSRDPNASEETVTLGKKRSEELRRILQGFVLRRDASVNEAFLPKLSSYAVFCRPSDLQIEMMKRIIDARWDSDVYAKEEALVLLTKLRKVCGHPRLLPEDCGSPASHDSSGKMHVLMKLLTHIVFAMNERAVVVSQWTSMLDIVQQACSDANISIVRLDGATPVSKRQEIVDSFNNHGIGSVFLLSTAAGGAGLNLIGSSKLVLCDSSWNPALDNQAMARIWRDGQKKDCSIYRLLTTGTMEEKVYQRQMLKGDLAQVSVYGDATTDTQRFSKNQLKELFEIELGTSCMTSDILEKMGTSYEDVADDDDAALQAVRDSCPITFVYKETMKKSSPAYHQRDDKNNNDQNNNNTYECTSIQGDDGRCNDGLSDLDIDMTM